MDKCIRNEWLLPFIREPVNELKTKIRNPKLSIHLSFSNQIYATSPLSFDLIDW